MGVSVANFPNLFMITGPNGPFSNIPPAIEIHVEFIADTIALAEKNHQHQAQPQPNNGKGAIVEATLEAERGWTDLCNEYSKDSLFRKSPSWIFGANVPGKKYSSLFFFGGLKDYRDKLQKMVDGGYVGYKPF